MCLCPRWYVNGSISWKIYDREIKSDKWCSEKEEVDDVKVKIYWNWEGEEEIVKKKLTWKIEKIDWAEERKGTLRYQRIEITKKAEETFEIKTDSRRWIKI